MDYAVLPPEINSGRMYAGAGSGPMVAAAAAWDGLASELHAMATSYHATLAELTSAPWVGPSATAMANAAAPYLAWITSTAVAAGQTANQLQSAAAAYEAAFAATVPPPEIEVNRALLASLVATNIFGQNTPAIAATEAQYARMWAQDAAAMYSYAGASATATTLTPFTQPPPTTTNGAPAQTAALPQAATGTAQSTLAQMAAIPNLLQTLSTGGSFDPVAWLHTFATSPVGTAINRFGSDFGNVATEFSGVAFVASGITPFFVSLYPLALPATAAAATSAVSGGAATTVTAASASAGLGDGAVTAGVGDAAAVGKLSVPPAWGSGSSPAIRLAALDVPSAGVQGVPQGQIGGTAGYYGLPPIGGLVNAPRGDQLRSTAGERHKVIPALARDMHADDAQGRQSKPPQTLRNVVSALSEGERDELDKLRREIAELATERDAAARLVKEALW